MAEAEVLSRRGIVGFLALLAGAPKAVEAQAMEVLRDRMFESDHGPPQGVGGFASTGHPRLTLEQMALKPFVVEARRQERRKTNAIRRCHSMSQAAKQAYIRAALQEHQPLILKWSKIMGWAGPDADESDLYG